ncbi:pilus (MSHA type) biogenesis protein MshL [Hydrogenovibrio kuenenii]|uniref:pilus (MSHA type) biogenesis protein MshL n=1 Tax=Hydrogenovibrio kuenenii TaxID=63658 RepID=UPI000466E468|nr:pilus (MSHA type) biogenesis protein MshL [Hydrogenovibrio kuenenii]
MKIKLFTLLFLLFGLQACTSSQSVKREPIAPPVSKDFDLKGHLTPKDTLDDVVKKQAESAPIPSLVGVQAINVNPDTGEVKRLYSVSAIQVPVADLLYHLSVDAKMQLDLSNDVTGLVTINAVKQPLKAILQRVTQQVGAVYDLKDGMISIRADLPYWHTYKVNYVNVSKQVRDSTVMKMSVGDIGNGTNTNNAQVSEFKMNVTSDNDFWGTLVNNITSMAQLGAEVTKSVHIQNGSNNSQSQRLSTNNSAANTSANTSGANTSSRMDIQLKAPANVVVNKEAGLVSVYTTRARHRKIAHYLDGVVHRTSKQVLIEATVVEVELNDQYQAGVDWSAVAGNNTASQTTIGTNFIAPNPVQALTLNLGSGAFNLRMLQQFGKTKVLSSPKIMAMNNQSAMLKVVKNQVYFTVESNTTLTSSGPGSTTFTTTVHTVPVGFMMNMTPFISDDGKISINIRPTLSRIVDYVNDPNPNLANASVTSKIPVVQEREMDSVLKLRNKQTAIIGGLIQDTHDNQRQGVPFLSAIPWVGDLFTYRDDTVKKTELIIFIRPIIIDNPDIDNGDLKSVRNFLRTKKN